MNAVLTAQDREVVLQRLDALTPSSSAQWGQMTVGEMVCHLGDQIRVALGDIQTPDRSSLFARWVMKRLVLLGLPVPKGKIETFSEIDQAKDRGTRPAQLDADRAEVRNLLSRFLEAGSESLQRHAIFGPMSKAQWARLVYIHMDHHLRQFGA